MDTITRRQTKKTPTCVMYSNNIHNGSPFMTTPKRQTMFGWRKSVINSTSLRKSACVLGVAFSFKALMATNKGGSPGIPVLTSPLYTFPAQTNLL